MCFVLLAATRSKYAPSLLDFLPVTPPMQWSVPEEHGETSSLLWFGGCKFYRCIGVVAGISSIPFYIVCVTTLWMVFPQQAVVVYLDSICQGKP